MASPVLFNAFDAHREFAAKVAALQIMRTGIQSNAYLATTDELESNAGYIEQLCILVAEHVEAVMADASAASSAGDIVEEDARAIADMGADLAAQLNNAAWVAEMEAA